MQVINKTFNENNLSYPIESIALPGDILFVDIETTGFSAATSNLYLIGCAYISSEKIFSCKQFVADAPTEEKEILQEFIHFISNFQVLFHYNGNNFDIPYLQDKCQKYKLECPLSDMKGIDIYRRITPYKNYLKIPNLKQKTIEQYLGINRKDIFNGGDLIGVYKEYVKTHDHDLLNELLLHNEEDILGMINITSMLAYSDLFNKEITVTKVNMESFTTQTGDNQIELIMKLHLPNPVPNPISHMAIGCFFKVEGNEGVLKVPVYKGKLKYFYANYKDYYYLPDEDEALHKSVASFVDKDHRIQATAATCYTNVDGLFLKQFGPSFEPFFKTDYSSKDYYLELTNERKKDRSFFSKYVSNIIQTICFLN